jgi:hypothetical protein
VFFFFVALEGVRKVVEDAGKGERAVGGGVDEDDNQA